MAVVCIGLTAAVARTTGADIADDSLPLKAEDLKSPVRLWDPSFSVSAGGGYKDNVALSHAEPESSAFFRSGFEGSLIRLPLDGTQVSLLLSGEDTRYFSSKTVDHEDNAFAHSEVRRFIGNDWQAALAVEGAYLDQVIDLSVTETNRMPVLVRGETLLARPGVQRDLAQGFWTSLELPGSRQYFEATLDDYWQIGPRLALGRHYGKKSELSLSYEFTYRAYDSELARTAAGVPIPGLTRATYQHEAVLAWKQHWDERQRWRTTTKLGFRDSMDNASGYFNYRRVQVAEQVRFRAGRWQLTAEVRFGFYEFPVQTVGGPGTALRDRSDLTFNVRAEYQLAPHVRLYAQYDREQTLSNLTLDEYSANTAGGGLMVEF